MNSVPTEITDDSDRSSRCGWVLYDGSCGMCAAAARRSQESLTQRGFAVAPLQEPLTEMNVITHDGAMLGGIDAVLHLAGRIWWATPLTIAARVPIARRAMRGAYRWLAAHRHGISHAGAGLTTAQWMGWLPLVVLPLWAVGFRGRLAAWAFMWLMALAVFAGCKWLTWWRAVRGGVRPTVARSVGYLFLWPGMDAQAFLRKSGKSPMPNASQRGLAIANTVLGTVLLWGVVRLVSEQHLLLRGWIGMLGVILLLHFGSFHLVALCWQRAGIDARPIMQAPSLSTSLSEFWGRRWNLGFRQLAHELVFEPLSGALGPAGAGLVTFLVSGLIHELIISLPAGAGYGLPTAYFLLQGFGISAERSRVWQQLGLGRGLRGRFFAMALTIGPAFWLFHPPFVIRVVLPFLRAIGAC